MIRIYFNVTFTSHPELNFKERLDYRQLIKWPHVARPTWKIATKVYPTKRRETITAVTMSKLASLPRANLQGKYPGIPALGSSVIVQHWDHQWSGNYFWIITWTDLTGFSRTPLPARSRQTLPVLPTTNPSLARLREPMLTVRNSSPQSEMSSVALETRRIRLILVIALGAMILLQFLQLILTSTSEVGLLKTYEMTMRKLRSFETHHRFPPSPFVQCATWSTILGP